MWARTLDGRLIGAGRETFDTALATGDLGTCPPTLLEMRYSARNPENFVVIAGRLDALPHAQLTAEASILALRAQAEIAAAPGVSHRVKPVDLLIASVAAAEGLGVLHYDSIARNTSPSFESVCAAPRGSID